MEPERSIPLITRLAPPATSTHPTLPLPREGPKITMISKTKTNPEYLGNPPRLGARSQKSEMKTISQMTTDPFLRNHGMTASFTIREMSKLPSNNAT